MKVYQLHEHSGAWEDFSDIIIGSYLRKERAEEEKARLELKEKELRKQSKKCANCPFIEEEFESIEDLLLKHSNYCNRVELEETDYGINCENYYSHWYPSTFKIEELEVEE